MVSNVTCSCKGIAGTPSLINTFCSDALGLGQRGATSKCIVIEDSCKQILGAFYRKSFVVTPRNPWAQDPAIDYEMDSEDELAEE